MDNAEARSTPSWRLPVAVYVTALGASTAFSNVIRERGLLHSFVVSIVWALIPTLGVIAGQYEERIVKPRRRGAENDISSG